MPPQRDVAFPALMHRMRYLSLPATRRKWEPYRSSSETGDLEEFTSTELFTTTNAGPIPLSGSLQKSLSLGSDVGSDLESSPHGTEKHVKFMRGMAKGKKNRLKQATSAEEKSPPSQDIVAHKSKMSPPVGQHRTTPNAAHYNERPLHKALSGQVCRWTMTTGNEPLPTPGRLGDILLQYADTVDAFRSSLAPPVTWVVSLKEGLHQWRKVSEGDPHPSVALSHRVFTMDDSGQPDWISNRTWKKRLGV